MMRYRVIEVAAGGKADDDEQWADRRTELWGKGRAWMERGGMISKFDEDLHTDMTAPLYEYNNSGRLKLEPVKSLKKRGYHSPNGATALFLTFDRNIGRANIGRIRHHGAGRVRVASGMDYNLFG